MRIKAELEQVTQLKSKAKAVFTFDRQLAGHFTNFADKPITIEILVDEPEQAKRLAQISPEQRRKIYALLKDIGNYVGDSPEAMKDNLKMLFAYERQLDDFSLSDCALELASDFIEWLINWAFENGVELTDKPKDYFDDTGRYVAMCIKHNVCVICGKPGDIHHINAIGMGRNRDKYDDSKHAKTCLCRGHHTEAHQIGWDTFNNKYHLEVLP